MIVVVVTVRSMIVVFFFSGVAVYELMTVFVCVFVHMIMPDILM